SEACDTGERNGEFLSRVLEGQEIRPCIPNAQPAGNSVLVEYKLLRSRILSRTRWPAPGDRLVRRQSDKRRCWTSGAKHESDVRLSRRRGTTVKIVIKIGGTALEDEAPLHKCARAVGEMAKDGHKVAVVHGGGTALTRTLKLLGKQSDFINGLRITDAETRDVALMVLAGMVNKKVVAAIVKAGLPAVGFCGG